MIEIDLYNYENLPSVDDIGLIIYVLKENEIYIAVSDGLKWKISNTQVDENTKKLIREREDYLKQECFKLEL